MYADKAEEFNQHVTEACKLTDTGEIRKALSIQTKPLSPNDEQEEKTSDTESEDNISATNRSKQEEKTSVTESEDSISATNRSNTISHSVSQQKSLS